MPVMEISIDPIGVGDHMSPAIARAVKVLERAGVEHQITPMGTIVQADVARLIELAREMHEVVATTVPRVVTTIRIDDRHGAGHRLGERVDAVREALETGESSVP